MLGILSQITSWTFTVKAFNNLPKKSELIERKNSISDIDRIMLYNFLLNALMVIR